MCSQWAHTFLGKKGTISSWWHRQRLQSKCRITSLQDGVSVPGPSAGGPSTYVSHSGNERQWLFQIAAFTDKLEAIRWQMDDDNGAGHETQGEWMLVLSVSGFWTGLESGQTKQRVTESISVGVFRSGGILYSCYKDFKLWPLITTFTSVDLRRLGFWKYRTSFTTGFIKQKLRFMSKLKFKNRSWRKLYSFLTMLNRMD